MTDWGGTFDKFVDGAARGIDRGKELLGEGIDATTDKIGAGLERVGAHDWADKVEDWGDGTASSLGAEVGEKQLGQSEEADELIHGKPEKITATVKNLRDFQKAFDLVGGGLRKLDSGRWRGEAADAFRRKFQTLPTDWLRAADAFEDAAKALETYASAVTSAQGKARAAIALYREGRQDSEKAVAAFNKKVDAYNAARTGDQPLPHPGTFSDPGVPKQKRAQEDLEDARRSRNEAGERARSAVAAAMAHAPEIPTGRDRFRDELIDRGMTYGVELTHVGGGVVKGVAGLAGFLRQVNPLDAYNLTHPAEYYKGVNMTLSALTSTAANPDRALQGAWEAMKSDPSEFGGRLLPEAIGTKGVGAVRSLARSGLHKGAKADGPSRPGSAREGHERAPDSNGKQCDKVKCAGDPIDVATGRMLLPQTDIALPGSLPLVFSRVFDSSYRSGHWFGTGWSSSVDQRLEIDAEGVVFACDQGSLLAYPHPAPGVPVMPTHGRRWPLDRVDDGYTITDPETGQVRRFVDQNADLALLVQIDDRNGRWITFEYDEAGAPTSIVHHGGYHLKLTTAEERVTALHLAGAAPDGTDQEILRYGYTDGHLTAVTNSSGRPLRFDCDELGRITAWTDTNDSRYEYVYDDLDRCIHQSGTNGHLEAHFTWDGTDPETGLRMTSMTDGLGHIRQYVINERAQVVAETDAVGAVTRFEYDRYHQLLSVTDPLGHVSRSVYNDHGLLTRVVRPDGREMTAEYNSLGLAVRIRHADGKVTHQTYDDRGNRTSVTDSSGATTTFSYDNLGNFISVENSLGERCTIRRDAAGLPLEITDPMGGIFRYKRDTFGRLVILTDPIGRETSFRWTTEGRLSSRTNADGTIQSWKYDGEGNCTAYTDAMGGISSFQYTHFDLMEARTGPDGVRYEFDHDTNLQLIQVRNPLGSTWNYEYDPTGHLASETDFDNRKLTYEFDASGRLVKRTNGLGETIRYRYNELGQILGKDAAGTITTYEYDIFDQLARATSPDVTLTRLRDQHGRLRSETVNGRTLTYGHDILGRRISRTTPTGTASTWTYDAGGQPATLDVSGRKVTFERDIAGREVSRRIGDATRLTHEFDASDRLTGQQISAHGRTVRSRAYTYRADGNLVGVNDSLGESRTFDVDASGRVTGVHAPSWTESYAYDQTGSQTEASWPASHPGQESTGTRIYTGTRISRAGRTRYEHDAQGRIVQRQKIRLSRKPETWRYSWDAEDRLTSVVTPDGKQWNYLYDPLGRRIAKHCLAADGESVAEQVWFTWDGTTLCEQVIPDQNLETSIALTWEHDGFRPIIQTERILTSPFSQTSVNERFFAMITDLVGNPTELIGESGDLAWHSRSTLWGTTSWSTNSTTYTPLRFPGQYFDPETGLHYNFHRYYDPEISRYLSVDLLGLTPAFNPVSYVGNPHTWADPLGLGPCPPPSLADAKNRALREAGVPAGAEPLDVNNYVPATAPAWQGGKQLMDGNHQPIYYTEEWYETASGDIVVFQDHYFGHQKPGEPGYQPAHIHVRPFDNTRNGHIPGTEEHYYYDKTLD
ncbi:putative T7SS-secreted protein [Streptomyces sp. NPDC057552]|uniref:putative T7SS-secreted protein n=1 Tax=Streptomyces sp. NPDC057552 TaxID=3350537 RepID=UPI003694822B